MEHVELGIGVFQYEFPEELAKNLVEVARQLGDEKWFKSGVGVDNDAHQEVRTSRGLSLAETFPFWNDEVRKYTTPALNDYTAKMDVEITQDEGFNMLRYGVSNKYDFHTDANWTNYRTVSALVYLNPSEYEGGETFFKYFDLKVKPEKPSIVVFPSNYAYLHAALPVTEGEKIVLVTWCNDMPAGYPPTVLHNLGRLVGKF